MARDPEAGVGPGTRTVRTTVTQAAIRVTPAPGPARLLGHVGPTGAVVGLRDHRRSYPPPHAADVRALRWAIDRSGLQGRGGAGFPTARKIGAVAERGGHVVVVNATEGEPASAKDRLLVTTVPHFVLDGAELAARATGADEIIVCTDWTDRIAVAALGAAIDQRTEAGEPAIELVLTPPRYVAGEETALVNFLNGGPAKPTSAPSRPFEKGVSGKPTLVHNAETLAHLALLHRYGPDWFRSCGTSDEPGTMLVSVTAGRRAERTVLEVALGTPGLEILRAAGIQDTVNAVLVGGYFGTWMRAADFAAAPFSRQGLQPFGAGPGAGIVIALPASSCGLAETARVLAWYAGESAGQCGPCTFGLPALAKTTAALARSRATPADVTQLRRWAGDIEGRGACRHPDGAVRLLRSALSVFGDDVERHLSGPPCGGAHSEPFLSVPGRPRRAVWR